MNYRKLDRCFKRRPDENSPRNRNGNHHEDDEEFADRQSLPLIEKVVQHPHEEGGEHRPEADEVQHFDTAQGRVDRQGAVVVKPQQRAHAADDKRPGGESTLRFKVRLSVFLPAIA